MESLEFLLYVDKEYVELIYNYYFPNVVEKVQNNSKMRNGQMEFGANLGKLFPVDINSDTTVAVEKVLVNEVKIKPSFETKIRCILSEKFNYRPEILRNLIQTFSENGIYYFQGTFELLALETKKGKNAIKNKKYLYADKTLTWKLRMITYDDYDIEVNMQLSGDKILINYRHLTHEIEKYKKFLFNILGNVSKLSEKKFTIKPIVIFYM